MTASGTLGIATGPTDPLSVTMFESVAAAASELGMVTRCDSRPASLDDVDVVLLVGPAWNFPDFLVRRPRARTLAWFGEPLPRDRPNDGAERSLSSRLIDAAAGRRALEVLRRPLQPLRHVPLPGPLAESRAAAVIARECAANLQSAIECARVVDGLITTSRDRARVLARHGVEARVVPYGYHPAFAGPIVPPDIARDIPVLLLGSQARGRHAPRGLALSGLSGMWGPAEPVVADGVWGPQRDALLRRASILLNIGRSPGNFAGIRLLIGLAAGAVVLSEPIDDPHPFVPGEHYVEAEPRDMPRVARELLADAARRHRIARDGQAFITAELSMARSLDRVLAS